MRTKSSFVVLVVALAVLASVSCGGNTATGPSDQFNMTGVPPQAVVPPSTAAVTVSYVQVSPEPPRSSSATKIEAWVFTPPGQGGMKSFTHVVMCNGATVRSWSGNANTEVGYSASILEILLPAGSCAYTATIGGSTASREFQVM